MTSLRSIAFRILGSLPLVACVTTPGNNGHVENTTDSISFSGVGLAPSRRVALEASGSARGPFTPVAGASALTAAGASSSVALPRGGSVSLYPFALTAAIPKDRWRYSSTAGCSWAETFVRVREGSTSYLTFDTDGAGIACIQERLDAGLAPDQALLACRSADSPVLRLEQGGFVHRGDAVIASETDLAALRCVHTIEGSLTVTSTAPMTIGLPLLRRVTGDVNLTYTSRLPDPPPAHSPYEAVRCGSSRMVTADVRAFNLPAFTTIDGNLTVVQEGSFSGTPSTQPIDLGLNAVASVGRDVAITIRQMGGSPCGLSALAGLEGNLTVHFDHGGEVDDTIPNLMGALASVAGTVTLRGGHNSSERIFPSLRRAGGLHIIRSSFVGGLTFPALTEVTGTVELEGTGRGSTPAALVRAGSLIVRNAGYLSLEQVGGPRLAVGNLELRDNPSLAALTASGASKVSLASSARLRLAGNPRLPVAEACAFVALQRRLGWTGSADLDGTICP